MAAPAIITNAARLTRSATATSTLIVTRPVPERHRGPDQSFGGYREGTVQDGERGGGQAGRHAHQEAEHKRLAPVEASPEERRHGHT